MLEEEKNRNGNRNGMRYSIWRKRNVGWILISVSKTFHSLVSYLTSLAFIYLTAIHSFIHPSTQPSRYQTLSLNKNLYLPPTLLYSTMTPPPSLAHPTHSSQNYLALHLSSSIIYLSIPYSYCYYKSHHHSLKTLDILKILQD